ncbi:MAG: hypothetical protein B6D59_06040 [Campylobacteraceae bacterium 4484_4]|nr:MAG: hypothetical protein B6D59_06040 [Campylobacteraceae bacterium 4484_4]
MKTTKDKNRFKPHLVEIEERPVSPLGRKILWAILIFMTLAALWLYFGKTDVVISARSTVIPMGDLQTIQALSTGSVKKIYVKEGDAVKKGEPLIEIDPTVEETNIEAKKRTLALLKLEAMKLNSLIEGRPFAAPEGTDPRIKAMIEGMYKSEKEGMIEQLARIDQQIGQIRERINATRVDMESAYRMYNMTRAQERRLKEVLDIIARRDYDRVRKERLNYQSRASQQRHIIAGYEEQLNELERQKQAMVESFRSSLYENLSQKEKQIAGLSAEIETYEYRKQKQVLASPVDGVVGKLAVNTIGAVVTPAQALVTIVPKDVPIQLKAKVMNKDIGFVKVGMEAKIKIDAYNFQRYGLIDGNVTKIGATAIEDKNLGMIYEVFVEPKQTWLEVEGEKRYLIPGMMATTELKVGERRIIEFFVYPLIKYYKEGISVQ